MTSAAGSVTPQVPGVVLHRFAGIGAPIGMEG